jgi:hypothetical protein
MVVLGTHVEQAVAIAVPAVSGPRPADKAEPVEQHLPLDQGPAGQVVAARWSRSKAKVTGIWGGRPAGVPADVRHPGSESVEVGAAIGAGDQLTVEDGRAAPRGRRPGRRARAGCRTPPARSGCGPSLPRRPRSEGPPAVPLDLVRPAGRVAEDGVARGEHRRHEGQGHCPIVPPTSPYAPGVVTEL